MTNIIDVSDNTFEKEVLDNNEPVLVDFWADWCAPCKKLAPFLEQIADNYYGRIKVCKANYEETSDIINKYGIMALPTLCIFKKGQIISKNVGIKSPKSITEEVVKALI